ncbi:23S rRNA (uracil(1939)-C(5))-methyltransferase RlmD [Mycoplasma leonicaptivi]|uniref:23S rRNA (uracil(1939)-C(5))-methyltransferase RlmD n=1 Tax=Mycoplasma leonicaptivi TaxID=36742 RepID=UPI00055B4E05|nr:23S rRNA (uracil(1939)-C(5))-methyltransferase RlmD [Mycoplasma leonicaptivi]
MNKYFIGQELTVECNELSFEGLGAIRLEDYSIFATNLFPGEKALIKLTKVLSNYAYAIVLKHFNFSNIRKPKQLKHTDSALFLNINYNDQLYIKNEYFKNLISRNLSNKNINLLNIEPSKLKENYRHKARYKIKTNEGKLILAEYMFNSNEYEESKSSFEQNILLLNKTLMDFIDVINLYIHKNKKQNLLKMFLEITIWINSYNETQILLEINPDFDLPKKLIDELKKLPNLSLLYVQKKSKNQLIFNKSKNDYQMQLFDKSFLVNPKSFFQINKEVTEKMFQKIIEFNVKHRFKNIYDLFCGTGVISQIITQKDQKGLGIDIVKESIDDANKNLVKNNLKNIQYITADIFKYLSKLKFNKESLVILDPPRSGLNISLIDLISNSNVKYLVYISCNPRTLVRDLKYLTEQHNYGIIKIQPYDMFPNTPHFEILTFLKKIK